MPSDQLQESSSGMEGPPPGTRAEALLVSATALVMLLLPVLESLSRRVFHKDIPGASLYTQHATLWIGFLGAALATAGGKHLGLSTANFLPRSRLRTFAEWYNSL